MSGSIDSQGAKAYTLEGRCIYTCRRGDGTVRLMKISWLSIVTGRLGLASNVEAAGLFQLQTLESSHQNR